MKKKILVIAIVSCILVLSIAGSSIAYFTDVEEATNVFTAGNVGIQLSEAKVVADSLGNLVKDDSSDRIVINEATEKQTHDYGKLFPSQTIFKDPTIKNIGTEKAYVGAIITITNDDTVSSTADITQIVAAHQLDEFITGINSNAIVKYEKFDGGYKLYILFTAVSDVNSEQTLFTGVKVFNEWDNNEMDHCKGLNIIVAAYATQTSGFADAKTAITTAFTDWQQYNNASDIPTVTP